MAPTCPPNDALRRYLIGDYSDDQGAEIEQHLSQCPACEDTLAGMDKTKDVLLRHLPLAAAEQASSSRPAWLDRLKAGVPAVPLGNSDEISLAEENPSPQGGLGSYELLNILGRGGMGVVYRARHRQLGRNVAIKVVHPKLTSALNARDRFEQEIRILGGMNHPGIVMATDAGRVGPAAYLVMELIDGVDLARLVREQGPLSIPQATEIARQVAEALAAAHDSNAIHRDVKPSNVMLDRDGCAKLLDFGLAHLSERANKQHETSLGHVMGTLDYMAPEQAEGNTVHAATDLYGLGALLFYLLTGEPPHGSSPDRTLLQQLKSITTSEPRLLASVRADVPDDLSQLVAQMLASQPGDRPENAGAVAKSLCSWAKSDSLASLTAEIKPDLQSDDKHAVDRSLCELLGMDPADSTRRLADQSASSKVVPTSATPATGSQIFKNLVTLVCVAAGLAGIWFGITVLLDTPTGQVQITSEVAGVEVELMDEKDHVTKLTVENKEKTTQLKVGKYRVRILEPHDGATLDKDTLTLTKGETAVATIREFANQKPASGFQTDPAPSSAFPAIDNFPKAFSETAVGGSGEIEFYIADPETEALIGKPVVVGEDIVSVEVKKWQDSKERSGDGYKERVYISINLTSEAGERFLKVTGENIGKRIAIVFEGQRVSAPTINSAIGSKIAFDGDFSDAEVKRLMAPFADKVPKAELAAMALLDLGLETLNDQQEIPAGTQGIKNKIKLLLDPMTGNVKLIGDSEDVAIIQKFISDTNKQSGDVKPDFLSHSNRQSKANAKEDTDEPSYKGHPRSYWAKRFKSEREPAEKLAAAEALLSLVSGSPAEQIEQQVKILGQLNEAAYGAELQDRALSLCSNFNSRHFDYWGAVASQGKLDSAELDTLHCSVRSRLVGPNWEQVAGKLVEMACDESPQTSAHALITMSNNLRYQIFGGLSAADQRCRGALRTAILNDLDIEAAPTPKLRSACLLLRAGLYRYANSTQRAQLVKDMEKAGRESVAIDVASEKPDARPDQIALAGRDRKFERYWLGCIRKWKGKNQYDGYRVKGVDSRLIAQVVLYDLINNNALTYFYARKETWDSPFDEEVVSYDRERAFPCWQDWINVANQWLLDNDTPENKTKVNRVFSTFARVLPSRLEKDNWDVVQTAQIITNHLRAHYQGKDSLTQPSAHYLLTDIILCGEPIPDFVVANPPADPKIRERLANLKAIVDSDLSYDQYVRRSTEINGLIQVAPFHTVKCIMTATRLPKSERSGARQYGGFGSSEPQQLYPIRLIRDASIIKVKDRPPINPLLLLAIISQLTQDNVATTDCRGLIGSNDKLFKRHLRDALRCATEVGPIAERWFQQMYDSAPDHKKNKILELKSR